MFFRFLAETRFRTIMKLLQKPVLEPTRAVLVPPSPRLKQQSETRVLLNGRLAHGGHVNVPTLGPISHISDPILTF